MAFWGAVVKPGKPHAFVPPPEEWNLHLSQATIAPTVPEGHRVALAVTSDPKDEAIIVCTLSAGRTDTAALDLFFSQYAEFSVVGDHEIHLTGYYTPSQLVDEEDDEEDEDMDYEPGALGFPIHTRHDGDEDEDEGDDEDEDEDDDLEGIDEDEDEDEDDDSMDEDEEMFGYDAMLRAKRKPHVVIEDITDHVNEEARKGGAAAAKAAAAKAAASKKAKASDNEKGKVAETNGEVSESEGEEVEDEEDGDEESEEEEDEEDEEEEEEDAPSGKAGKASLPSSSRRPAEATKPSDSKDSPAAKKHGVGQQQKPQTQPVTKAPEKKQETKQAEQNHQAAKQLVEKKDLKAGKKKIRRHPNGFEIEDVSYGNPKGKVAKLGQKVLVRYVGRLKANNKEFDRSGKKPFQFRLGVGQVIKGWDLGVEGMRVGDKRRLVVPPQLAYGHAGVKGTIPSNATLEFDVELVDVK